MDNEPANSQPSPGQVEYLLSELNSASTRINDLEKQMCELFVRRSYLLESAEKLYAAWCEKGLTDETLTRATEFHVFQDKLERLKAESASAVDRFVSFSAAYHDARTHLNKFTSEITRREHDVSHSQHSSRTIDADAQIQISHLTMEVIAAQANRDASEKQCVVAMQEFASEYQSFEGLRKQVGLDTIHRTRDYFAERTLIVTQISEQDMSIEKLRVLTKEAKLAYRGALLRLEELSNDTHKQRSVLPTE